MNVGDHPALFADRDVLLVMRDRAFDHSFNNEVFVGR